MKKFLVACLALMWACTPPTEIEIVDSIEVSDFEVLTPASASTVTIGVTASSDFWAAETDVNWCILQQSADCLTLEIEENTGAERSATITLSCGTAVATVTIHQEDGTPAPNTIMVSDLNVVTPAAGSTVTVGVTATNDEWEVKSNSDWCEVTKGDNAVTLVIAPNTADERTAIVTLTCDDATTQIEVKQEAAPVIDDALTVTNIDLRMPSTAGALTLNVTATSQWSIENSASWLTATTNEEGVLVLSFEGNEGPERTATVTLTCGEAKTVINITQEMGIRVEVAPTSLSFSPEGGTLEIGVSANVTWKASTTNKDWLTVTSKNDIVTVKAKANTAETERKGVVSITYSDGTSSNPTSIDVEVVQSAYSIVMLSEDIVLNSDQTSATVKFRASHAWTSNVCFAGTLWLAQVASPWATLSSQSGQAGEQTITVNFDGKDIKERTVSVVVTCGSLSKKVTITQKAVPAPSTGRKVRIMTFNQKVKGTKDIAKIITDLDIDFVAVQEIDMLNDRCGKTNQLDSLKKFTGYEGYFCKTIDFANGEYGVGILSKKAAISTRFVNLTGPESRKLFIAEYDDFVLATTHYTMVATEESMRKYHYESAQITVKELSKYTDKPVVLGGDFNTETDIDRAKALGEIMTIMDVVSDPTIPTYPSHAPELYIDYLFFKRDAKFPYVRVDGATISPTPSDHCAVWAELIIYE